MKKMEIILVYLCIHSFLNRLSWSNARISGKKQVVANKREKKKRNSQALSNSFYMTTIVTKFICMDFCDDEEAKYKNHKYSIDSKTEPEHSRKIKKYKSQHCHSE